MTRRISRVDLALVIIIPLFVLWLLFRPLHVSWNYWGMGLICDITGNDKTCEVHTQTEEKIDQAVRSGKR
ncbi:hypothetical protein [Pseudomonas protegens]|uniref:hypothetical protein n=1 Tax=Pseudomonas protegens TaxID=380021 RepID=UPI0011B219E5|nr:hypothetical protein [Pseudomonas protegens]